MGDKRAARFQPGIHFRVGDEWAFNTGNGMLLRRITDFGDGRVWYRGYGDPYERSCSLTTFRRWLRGAELHFATDWTGLDADMTPTQELMRLADEAKQYALCIFGDGDVRSDLRSLNECIDKLRDAALTQSQGVSEPPQAGGAVAKLIDAWKACARRARGSAAFDDPSRANVYDQCAYELAAALAALPLPGEAPETEQSIAADAYFNIAEQIGTLPGYSVFEHVQAMHEVMQKCSDFFHDFHSEGQGGDSEAVALAADVRHVLGGRIDKVRLEPTDIIGEDDHDA